MKYSPEIHHRKSIRLKEFDYSNPLWYYVTICTFDRISILGKVADNKVNLNKFGLIAEKCWKEIPNHFPNSELDYFVIMPNHIHGIIIINCRDKACLVLTEKNRFGKSLPGSLPTIIGSFKSAVSKQINELRNNHGKSVWQRNYYEHIIRNEKDLYNIRRYIELNPLKWEIDEYYK